MVNDTLTHALKARQLRSVHKNIPNQLEKLEAARFAYLWLPYLSLPSVWILGT